MKKQSAIALICVGVACILVCGTYVHNKKDMLNMSERCESVTNTESSQEEQCKPEGQNNYGRWEIEHVREIEFGQNESITQDDIIHIGKFIHLKRLKISIDESEIDLSPLESLAELESLDMDIRDGCSPDLSFMVSLDQDVSSLENLKNYAT